MGYRINYDSMHGEKAGSRRIFLTCFFFLLFLLGVGQFWPEGKGVLRNILFSGDDTVAVSAIKELTAHLENDVPVMDAVYAFCRKIFTGSGHGTY